MKIQLSEHFTYKKLLRFVLPSIIMMIFTSIYGIVDGLFVSNYSIRRSQSGYASHDGCVRTRLHGRYRW